MNKYSIELSDEAVEDIQNLEFVILHIYKVPLTAVRYIQGLKNTIKSLSTMPQAYPFYSLTSIHRYGPNTRRINYKEMAVIFAVFGSTVYIHCIKPTKTIKGIQ